MENKILESLEEQFKDEFEIIINAVILDLEKNNKLYQKLNEENSNIIRNNPNLTMIYESENPKNLNSNDINLLIKYLNNDLEMKHIIYEKMFILGNKEAYYYFKRMGII